MPIREPFEEKTMNKTTGTIFNIQKYSVHDGPGIRTTVFLKGCPLRCRWCSNPESQLLRPELAFSPHKCLGTDKCQWCIKACPNDAIRPSANGYIEFDADKCVQCHSCAKACPAGALVVHGEEMTVAQVIAKVEEDSMFYARSGGGMTLSGGEPFMQSEFALALFKTAKKHRINTCVETCGMCDTEVLVEAAGYLDTLIYDVKCMDPELHKANTGVSNEKILANLKTVREAHPDLSILVRTPVIPGFNDTEEEIAAICDFLVTLPGVKYELLPYHKMGKPKYESLGRPFPMDGTELDEERFHALMDVARAKRLEIVEAK